MLGNATPSTMDTVVRRLAGHSVGEPSGVAGQSKARQSPASSLEPAKGCLTSVIARSASDARTRSAFCVDVDAGFGDRGEELVGIAFLVERLLEKVCLLVVAEGARVGTDASVAGHLVVLDVLRGGDQPRVEDVGIGPFLDEALRFLDQPFHPLALLPLGGDVEL